MFDYLVHLADIPHIGLPEGKKINAQAMNDGEHDIDIKIPWTAAAVKD
jgi:hypothetical protein